MSDLSTNDRLMLNNMDFQNHINSRPKFQPIRVKELLHFCESDDDESEDKPQDSDIESDFDDPQPLPQDDHVEHDSIQSLSLLNVTSNKLKETCKESISFNNIIECEPKIKSTFHEYEHNMTNENMKCEHSNQMQLNIQTIAQEKLSQTEHKNKYITNIEIKEEIKEQLTQDQFLDQQTSCKVNNNTESIASTFQYFEKVPQFGMHNLQNINCKKEALESVEEKLASIASEEKIHHENVSSKGKSLISDTGTFVNSTDQWLQTPLKHASNSIHPDPCFSRRNIIQTPQNKLSDPTSKDHGLALTVSSHWSQNNIKQTPLQNKNINFKDSMQTPKNSFYFTSSIGKNETPRYFDTGGKLRKPLADTGSFIQNDAYNRHLLQGSQFPKVNEETPKIQNKSSCENLNKTDLSKEIFDTSENVEHLELKEKKYNQSKKDKLSDKETINKISNKHVPHCIKNNKEIIKSVYQNQHSEVSNQNQHQEFKKVIDNPLNLQFSMPSNIPKSRQNRTLFVKGKEYLILGTLGQGMSGEVLRAQDLSSLELCAIKCVNLNRMDKDSAQGCLEEISMLHKLQAPCVVKMFD